MPPASDIVSLIIIAVIFAVSGWAAVWFMSRK